MEENPEKATGYQLFAMLFGPSSFLAATLAFLSNKKLFLIEFVAIVYLAANVSAQYVVNYTGFIGEVTPAIII